MSCAFTAAFAKKALFSSVYFVQSTYCLALDGGDEYTTALVLAKAMEKVEYDLILAGFQAVDDGSAQVGARVAELLNIPQVTIVVKLEIDSGKAIATREVDDGMEIIEVPLPALFTAQQGLAEARLPSMKGIMQAKKKPLQRLTLADLGLSADEVGAAGARVKQDKLVLPDARKAGKIIPGEPEVCRIRIWCGCCAPKQKPSNIIALSQPIYNYNKGRVKAWSLVVSLHPFRARISQDVKAARRTTRSLDEFTLSS